LNPFLGEIRLFSFNYAPKGWAMCAGQLLPINQNQALFALLGTQFGGNGTQNFALPDLRSRVPVHAGAGYNIGEIGGVEQVTLNINQIPTHQHNLQVVNNTDGNVPAAIGNLLAKSTSVAESPNRYAPGTANLVSLNPASIQPAGDNQAHANIQPFLAMNYCIALTGIFPSRN
jgi:microcystin-dependent protein